MCLTHLTVLVLFWCLSVNFGSPWQMAGSLGSLFIPLLLRAFFPWGNSHLCLSSDTTLQMSCLLCVDILCTIQIHVQHYHQMLLSWLSEAWDVVILGQKVPWLDCVQLHYNQHLCLLHNRFVQSVNPWIWISMLAKYVLIFFHLVDIPQLSLSATSSLMPVVS